LDFLLGRKAIAAGAAPPQLALPFRQIGMNESSASSRSIGKTVLAGLVVLVAGYILLKIVVGIAVALAGTVAVILAIVAIIWAVRVLF
jgi:hypothetical protein